MDAATLTYDTLGFGEFEDFPETSEPVWILGKEFNALTEKDDILSDVTSRLWFTYRKNFPPIGGTGPTSDTGWGCMLRCGQMILGEALVCRHLGRDWRWVRGQPPRGEYIGILNAFLDKKDSYYSLHQIAQMGVGEGKSIGQWYGPNTVAQVLKKLTVFDSWSRLAVHVAMDNTVVMKEIKQLCMPWLDYGGAACAEPPGWMPTHNGCLEGACALAEEETALWKPLVLLIPLRLGLSDINKAYIETLKQCFQLPQSLGVIGGKPNSAHYFIGYVGEELIYLDPHTTQSAVEPCEDSQVPDDTYHCQHPPCRMHICEIDPSVAVGFFCRTEDDFDDWCMRIRKLSHTRGSLPMFELVDCQPSHFACSVDVLNLTPDEAGIQSEVRCGQARCTTDKAPFKGNFPDVRGDRVHDFSDRLERFFDSEDEEFEILSL
ncbi:cysteine protease ATG4B isoform X1 [Salmo salar]|uniref:Cysteine protease n=1 Tax=Salmo salar TaxID=8030 RepID=A0A1S3MQH7_SALSA|nr:cysteine protease ATG4B-like isoform X1 [Salmo salar]|eukprot:XP_014005340.1 PREDICTED: cysteine protease ATG4B-like isoform X1 [Salmo salar]